MCYVKTILLKILWEIIYFTRYHPKFQMLQQNHKFHFFDCRICFIQKQCHIACQNRIDTNCSRKLCLKYLKFTEESRELISAYFFLITLHQKYMNSLKEISFASIMLFCELQACKMLQMVIDHELTKNVDNCLK